MDSYNITYMEDESPEKKGPEPSQGLRSVSFTFLSPVGLDALKRATEAPNCIGVTKEKKSPALSWSCLTESKPGFEFSTSLPVFSVCLDHMFTSSVVCCRSLLLCLPDCCLDCMLSVLNEGLYSLFSLNSITRGRNGDAL